MNHRHTCKLTILLIDYTKCKKLNTGIDYIAYDTLSWHFSNPEEYNAFSFYIHNITYISPKIIMELIVINTKRTTSFYNPVYLKMSKSDLISL